MAASFYKLFEIQELKSYHRSERRGAGCTDSGLFSLSDDIAVPCSDR